MSVGDARKAPFVWQSTAALRVLRENWDPGVCRPALGLALYQGLTEIANEDRARTGIGGDSEGFTATRRRIAAKSCVSTRSVDTGLEELARVGLLTIERRKNGSESLSNLYTLLEPDAGAGRAGGSAGIAPPPAQTVRGGGAGIAHIDTSRRKENASEEEASTEASSSSDVQVIFDAWIEVTGKTSRTKLDGKRRGLITRALKLYPVEDLVDAVRGWRHSKHHRGENDSHAEYNALGLLLRDADHIEMFRDLERKHGDESINSLPEIPGLHSGVIRSAAFMVERRGELVTEKTLRAQLVTMHQLPAERLEEAA